MTRANSTLFQTLLRVATASALVWAFTGVTTSQANTSKVRVYFAICEGSGASDTVKIKRINEDGSDVATIGDTTVAYCSGGDIPDRYFSGLAVHNGYAYFSWFKADNSAAGIGRMSTTEPGAPDLNFAVAPASVYYLQLAPRVLNNYLYLFAYDETPSQSGPPETTNERMMRVALTGGEIQTCFTPPAPIEPQSMAIGVGKDAAYYSLTKSGQGIDMSQELYKVESDCSDSTKVLDLGMGQAPPVMIEKFQTFASASFLAESDTRLYMVTQSNPLDPTQAVYRISHLDAGGTVNDVVVGGTATSPDNSPIPSLVWGVNRLYFKNGSSTKMYAVTPGQEAAEVFADQMTGTLHHISVVSEVPTSTTTSTTSTTSTTTTTTTTVAPSTTSTTTTTVAPSTTATAAKATATRRTVKLKSGSSVKPLIASKSKRSVTAKSLLQLPTGARVTKMTTSTRSVCTVKKTTLRTLKKGTCRYKVTITHKGKTTTLSTTLRVS